MDILTFDQHDKWKRFGLWLHVGLDPLPGRLAWLKIWWTNRNPRLITSYYIEACRQLGEQFLTFCRLLLRWLAIPWLQRELDNWLNTFNWTPRRADKHKVMPHGIPNLMLLNPEQYGTHNYKIEVTPEKFDEMEAKWAPPDDPVFQLVPPLFKSQVERLQLQLGTPEVTGDNLWDVYSQLLTAFESMALEDEFMSAIEGADDHFESSIELLEGQKDLPQGAAAGGNWGYEYYGGLTNPPPDDGLENNSEEEDGYYDPRQYAEYLAATFTPVIPVKHCQRCNREIHDPASVRYIQSQQAGQEGRYVCSPCHQYYQMKQSTIRRPIPSVVDEEHVRKQVAIGQRNSKGVTVQHLGPSAAGPSAAQMGPPALAWNAGQQLTVGSFNNWNRAVNERARYDVRLPVPTSSAPYYATGNPAPAVPSGYTPVHGQYAAERLKRQNTAYALHSGYTVVVDARVSYTPMGKTKITLVGNVFAVFDNVPAHIGAVDLLRLCWDHVKPLWDTYTFSFPLSIQDVTLRDDKWVPLSPKQPDVDAISSKFFHAKAGTAAPQFRSKKIVLHLEISAALFESMMTARENHEEVACVLGVCDHSRTDSLSRGYIRQSQRRGWEAEAAMSQNPLLARPSLNPSRQAKANRKWLSLPCQLQRQRTRTASTVALTPPRSKRARDIPASPESPPINRMAMKSLVEKQMPASRIDVNNFMRNKVLTGLAYVRKSFSGLTDLQTMTSNWETVCDSTPETLSVVVTMDPRLQMVGSFKIAYLATAFPPIFGTSEIVIKQTYYKTKNLKVAGNAPKVHMVVHEAVHQVKSLIMEMRCLAWAHALLVMVYRFMQRFEKEHGSPPFTAPVLRFVGSALFYSGSGADKDVHLLEERIVPAEGKQFMKYINNGAAVATVSGDEEEDARAEFLLFTQHVQFERTHKMVFVSDYQGGLSRLVESFSAWAH
ncbi:hypothetical protein R3P38DRAFT_2512453 [Favolaschia claudopus]|uniref:Alpha-type protein kinase domain-containing protein n=1 Tax=Favolaschia claudopus TaxID=2862362 RepID=A0AAW0CNV2_9AGAR